MQILSRRTKNNPCIIGEPGVGKTAIAEGIAQKLADGDVPFRLQGKELYMLGTLPPLSQARSSEVSLKAV